ncbi:hypothetical protein AHAS_Ahas10G0177100 [Arachis hypogaea]
MLVPILAGILSALRRVIARRVSIKNQLKRRLHALTIASATCFMFPFAMWDMIIGSPSGDSGKLPFSTWAFLSTIFFGNIVIFYADSIAEERYEFRVPCPGDNLLTFSDSIECLKNIGFRSGRIAHGFLFTKTFNSSWCMHHHHGECVQDGFFSHWLHGLLLNIRFWFALPSCDNTFLDNGKCS